VFFVGLLMLAMAVAMIVEGAASSIPGARFGLIGGGLVLAASGLFLAYLGAPSRPRKDPPGMARGKATVLGAARTAGEVAGYPMVEVTLEVRPKDGVPYNATRKFSAGRLGLVEPGRTFDVLYDPANPQRIELP
jgi:hypothetical protein